MSDGLVVAITAAGVLAGLGLGFWLPSHGRLLRRDRPDRVRRILLPLTGPGISRRAFEAAVRLAQAEDATLMPAFLARVPRQLPIDSPLPAQSTSAMPLLELIEQRAAAMGVRVDGRVERGRTYRDALQRLLASEEVDRIVVSAGDGHSGPGHSGLSHDDLRWLLERVPGEVLILRPAPADDRSMSPKALAGHF